MADDPRVQNLTPQDVARGLTEGRMLLVDVREPNETAVERYPDAVDRAAVGVRSGGDPRSAGQAGGVRLPLRQPLGDRLAGGAGGRAALQRASGRRHHGLEGSRTADRDADRLLTDKFAAGHPQVCCHAPIDMPCPASRPPLVAAAWHRLPARRPARSASSTSTTGRTTSTRRCSKTSPRRPASRCATTPSTPTTRWRPSCSPASPATTSWCRPPISSSARSRPACSRSSTRRSCRTSAMSGPRSPSGSRPTIPATSTPSTTCGARPASATT